MADDNKININLNVNNQIKAAEQQKVQQKKSDSSKSESKPIIPEITIQTSKFVEELSKSKLFQNIDSSLSKISDNIQNLNGTAQTQQLKKTLENIQNTLKLISTNTETDYKKLPQIFANDTFFKDLFTNLQDINTRLKLKFLNDQTSTTSTNNTSSQTYTSDIVAQFDPFFENINNNLSVFSDKFDQLLTSVNNINLDNIITKQDISDLLIDYKTFLTDQLVQSINTSLNQTLKQNNNSVNEQLVNKLIQKLNETISNISNPNTQKSETQNIVEAINLNIQQQKSQTANQVKEILANTNIALSVNSNIKMPEIQQYKPMYYQEPIIWQQQPIQQKNEQKKQQESTFNISDDSINNLKNLLTDYQTINDINLYTTSNINIKDNKENLTQKKEDKGQIKQNQTPIQKTQQTIKKENSGIVSSEQTTPGESLIMSKSKKPQIQIQKQLVQTSTSISKPVLKQEVSTERSNLPEIQISGQKKEQEKPQQLQQVSVQTQQQQKTKEEKIKDFSIDMKERTDRNLNSFQENLKDYKTYLQSSNIYCKILTDESEKTKLESLLNSANIQDMKTAINILQEQINRLIEIRKDETQSQSNKKICFLYISTLQNLLQLAQWKLKQLISILNQDAASQGLQKVSQQTDVNITADTSKKEVLPEIKQPEVLTTDTEVLTLNKPESIKVQPLQKQVESDTTSDDKTLTEDIKQEQKAQPQTIAEKIISELDFKNQQLNLYGKNYLQTTLSIQEEKSKKYTKQSLSDNKVEKILQRAKSQFLSSLYNNKILVINPANNRIIAYDKKQLIKGQEQPIQQITKTVTDYTTQKPKNIQAQQSRENTNTQVAADFISVLKNMPPPAPTKQVNEAAQQTLNSTIIHVNDNNSIRQSQDNTGKNITDFSEDKQVYNFYPKQNSEDYNNYILSQKYDYIINKHLVAQKNNTITQKYDQQMSDIWDQQYKNGIVLSLKPSPTQEILTGKKTIKNYSQTSENVMDLRKRYGVMSKGQQLAYNLQTGAQQSAKEIMQSIDILSNLQKRISKWTS